MHYSSYKLVWTYHNCLKLRIIYSSNLVSVVAFPLFCLVFCHLNEIPISLIRFTHQIWVTLRYLSCYSTSISFLKSLKTNVAVPVDSIGTINEALVASISLQSQLFFMDLNLFTVLVGTTIVGGSCRFLPRCLVFRSLFHFPCLKQCFLISWILLQLVASACHFFLGVFFRNFTWPGSVK